MPVTNVTTGETITEAWGDAVADSVNALETDVTALEATAPTAGQKAALAGSTGTPGAGNKYVTDTDTRLSDSRTATAHGTTHNPGAADPVTTAIAGASAVGDTAAVGTAGSLARSDHRHSRESFGASASTQAFGDAAAAGSASTPSRSDHKHAMPANPVTAAQGSAFPGSPATNDRFFRTDLGALFYYDGTRWLTVNRFFTTTSMQTALFPFAATSLNAPRAMLVVPTGFSDAWVEEVDTAFFVAGGTALSGSHKWVITTARQPGGSSLVTVTIDSGSVSVWRADKQAVNALWTATNFVLETSSTKTGTPGNLTFGMMVSYRLVAT